MGTYSGATNNIIKVLETRLAEITSVPTSNINFINTFYTPNGETFLQDMIFSAEPRQASLGTYGQFRFDGIYTIDIHSPTNVGRSVVNSIVKELMEMFSPGTTLTNDEISVKCKAVWESTQEFQDNWYIVPINVRYFAYTGR